MLRGVVDLMDHLLPESICPFIPLRIDVADDACQVGLPDGGNENAGVEFDIIPVGAGLAG